MEKTYLTVKQMAVKHPCFTEAALRYYLFNRDINGLSNSGAIIKMGSKIFLEEEKFLSWIESHNIKKG